MNIVSCLMTFSLPFNQFMSYIIKSESWGDKYGFAKKKTKNFKYETFCQNTTKLRKTSDDSVSSCPVITQFVHVSRFFLLYLESLMRHQLSKLKQELMVSSWWKGEEKVHDLRQHFGQKMNLLSFFLSFLVLVCSKSEQTKVFHFIRAPWCRPMKSLLSIELDTVPKVHADM